MTNVTTTSPTSATVHAADSGPQGFHGASPVFTSGGELAPITGGTRIYVEERLRIDRVRLAVSTPPTGRPVIVDVNVNGESIYADPDARPRIAPGEHTSVTAADFTLEAGDFITVDVDQAGSPGRGADLTVAVHTVTEVTP